MVAAVVLVGAVLLVPGLADRLGSALLHLVGALRALGHGTLTLGDGFVAAIAVTLVTALLPVLLAGASRASRPAGVAGRALVSAVVVLAAAVVVAAQSSTPGERFRSVVLAGLVGVAIGALLDAAWHARHSAAHASGRTRRVAWTLAAAYALLVVLVATAGSPVDRGIHPWLTRAIAAGHRLGAPQWLDYGSVEFTANVLFFVPFGFFVLLLFGHARGGSACSAGSWRAARSRRCRRCSCRRGSRRWTTCCRTPPERCSGSCWGSWCWGGPA